MNAKYWLVPTILAVLPAACGDLLTESPRSQIAADDFFKTAADASAAIAAAYRPLSDFGLFAGNIQWAANAASDHGRVGPEEENATIIALTQLQWDSRNGYVTGPWASFYSIITRANLILERVPDIPMSETLRNRILGEAKFLRALSYFYLVRFYGDVPLVTTTAEQLTPGPRTPQEQVLTQLIQDAQDAEGALPPTWEAGDRGRATQGAAQALLADVYLWRKEWEQAASYAKKVIDSGTFALEPNYISAFLPGSQNRREEVFAAQASDATGAAQISIAAWTYPRAMNPNANGGWGTYVPLQWFLDSYLQGDYRKDASYFTTGMAPGGSEVTFAPHIHKYRPSTRPGPQNVNWPIYRYAEVLLIHAEALNEMGRSAEAVTFVNQIRARARNGTGGESRTQPADLAGLSQDALRDAIFQEREWELAFEGKRWFDLVRRGWEFFHAALTRDPTATDVQQTDMLWPVPQAQIDLNPQLTQNPGY
jgi:hypothetical protein